MMFCSILRSWLLTSCLLIIISRSAIAQGTAFTYQGRLNDGGSPANGNYDLRFTIYDSTNDPGVVIAGPVTNSATAVSNGLFTVVLDFGNQFPGAARWLGIGVRTNGAATFTNLSPRQRLTATPYAVYANDAGTVAAANILGTIEAAQLAANVVTEGESGVNLTGTFNGSGAGLTGINLLYANSYGAFQLVTNYDGGNFTLIDSPAVGDVPQSIAAADVNGDGRVDLISANGSTSLLTVLTNNGNGAFTFAGAPGTGLFALSVTTTDVNSDGRPDFISAGNNSLSVFTNNGSGVFILAATLGTSNPFNVKAADVNADGKVDLVCVNATADMLSVLTNNGAGNFILASTPATGSQPRGLAIADVNGDGKLDLINGRLNASTLSVLTNHGNGNFTLASSPGVAGVTLSVTAADVNGDGKVDLIGACLDTGLSVLTNNGTGSFASAGLLNLGTGPRDVTAADVNGDGKVDLISANQNADTLSVLTNNGSGAFTLVSSPAVGDAPQAVIAADVNGDGATDLVSANSQADTLSVLLNTPFFNSAILSGKFFGNGAGVTNVNAATLNGVSSAGFWHTSGNAGTAPGTHFLGTSDVQPLDFRVNNRRGLRLEYANDGFESVNVIGGSSGNMAGSGVVGATIAGGGSVLADNVNRVLASFGTVGGGMSNTAGGLSATVSGGQVNTAGGQFATIGGGYRNSASGQGATIGGGQQNSANGNFAAVHGGRLNTAANFASVGGGSGNAANWDYTAIGGGSNNIVDGDFAMIPGGSDNRATLYSFAAGRQAKANHAGTFVWADVNAVDFASTGINQFLIRATSGVGINKNNPATSLDVNGTVTATGFSGSGASLTGLSAGNLNGTIPDARLSTNVALRSGGNAFSGNQTITGTLGVGTTSPQASLHVYSANNPTVVRVQSTGTPGFGRVEFVSNPQGDTNEWRPGYIQSTDNGGFTGGLAFFVNGTGAGSKFGNNEVMRVVNGAVGIGIATPATALHVVGTVTATAFNPPSDRNLKENFAPVSPREVLEKVAALPISRWNFKGDAATPHVGPMAQDFHAAFKLGTDERHIATVDADGVALAAIQGLNQKLEETRAENAALKARLEKLEALLNREKDQTN
jgi:hypothetical protein